MRTLKTYYNCLNNEQKFIVKYVFPFIIIMTCVMLITSIANNLPFVIQTLNNNSLKNSYYN